MPSATQTMVIQDDRLGGTVKEFVEEFHQVNAGRQVDELARVFRRWSKSIAFKADEPGQTLPGQRLASEQETSGVQIVLATIRIDLAVFRQGSQDPAKRDQALASLKQNIRSLQAPGVVGADQAPHSQSEKGKTTRTYDRMLADGNSAPVYGDFVADTYQGSYTRPPTRYSNSLATGFSTPLYGNKFGGADPYEKPKDGKK